MNSCPNGHEVPTDQTFCGQCGTRILEPVSAAENLTQVEPLPTGDKGAPSTAGTSTSNGTQSAPKGKNSKIAIAVVGIIAGVVVLGAIGSMGDSSDSTASLEVTTNESSESNPTPSDELGVETEEDVITYEDFIVDNVTTDNICENYSTVLETFDEVVSKRTKSLSGKADDPYTAATFVRRNAWVSEDDALIKFQSQWEDAATTALNSVSDGRAGQLESTGAYFDASLEECGLSDAYKAQLSSVIKVNATQRKVVSAADRKPWYPKGYSEYPGEDLAYKYTKGGCESNYGYCWSYTVISAFGCLDGVYAEGNILQNDTIISWTNDTIAYLPPLKRAQLEMQDFGGSGTKSFEMTQMSCSG
jgi:hypothetical protein